MFFLLSLFLITLSEITDGPEPKPECQTVAAYADSPPLRDPLEHSNLLKTSILLYTYSVQQSVIFCVQV